MKLIPKYSYEFNCILNPDFNENDQIKNFASLISDKDRFLVIVSEIEKNSDLISEKLGNELIDQIDFYVVRAEKFKSFSEPVVVEYSLLPEEMAVYLIREIIKISVDVRFPDDDVRDNYVNSLVKFICSKGKFSVDLEKHTSILEGDLDFSKTTMKEEVEKLYG